jgi:outer membrane protein TolC
MSHSPMLCCAQQETSRNALSTTKALTGFEHRVFWFLLMLAFSISAYGETTEGLTVQEAIQLALDNNPQYQQLLDSVKVAKLDLELARSVFRSRISSTASTQSRLGSDLGKYFSLAVSKKLRSGSEVEAGFFTSEYTGNALSELRLKYTRPLFSDPERSGLLSLQKAERDTRHVKRLGIVGAEELAAKIIKAYYQALQTKGSVTIQEGILRNAVRTARSVQARQRRGLASSFELKKAQLEVSAAEQNLNAARSHLQDNYDNLKMLMGNDVEDKIKFNLERMEAPRKEPQVADISTLQDLALANRYEVLDGKEVLDYKYERMNILNKRRGAPIDVSLQYSVLGQGMNFEDSVDFNDQRIGIGLSMNTDFGMSKQRTHTELAIIDYERSSRDFEQLQKEIKLEVRNAARDVARRQGNLKIAEEKASIAEKQFELAQIRFEKGLSDALELLRAQQELSEASNSHLMAKINYLEAILTLDMSVGQLRERWDLPLPK